MSRVITVLGIIVMLGILFLLSDNKKAINKRTVGVALAAQLVLALFLIKVPVGSWIIEQLAAGVTKLFSFANEGLSFVFGDLFGRGYFFIDVLGVIIFLSALTGILGYLGVVGWVVKIIGGAVGKLLGTEKAESFVAVANMLLGQTEAPFLVAKYLPDMTKSELMTVLVAGMGSMSASILVGYNLLGIPMKWLLITTALVPFGSLLVAKILTPETEVSKVTDVTLDRKGSNTSLFSAMAEGINNGLQMVLGIGASLIAGISIVALLNSILGLVGTSFTGVLGYIFMPIGWLMGLSGTEAMLAGQLLGTKLSINEFVAYADFAPMMSELSERAIAMISVAVGSFGAFSSIAICVTGLSVFAPTRKNDLSKLALRGMFGGFIVPILSAMFIGLFL
ncbi:MULTISPECIES: NupC/NupG family nucleoside CNT transporter [Carnobacterium]|uniref:Nucleoside transporter n=1 Tax=Carnobacterium inhibens subsp. gilichinskyi TaxID=1266845 RepID=U5SF47_9LACT|nr:nucleoside transporter C-terminal domain-containing protein [Carnobacterium inhibens]AGY82507.1 nucleoside transporter [Carnobacterium inhibens subsp. gilichinskyi]MCM3512066.1 NupC/NupG family nucleoside CNT transporter [Carnobacterium inhibens]